MPVVLPKRFRSHANGIFTRGILKYNFDRQTFCFEFFLELNLATRGPLQLIRAVFIK